MIVCEACARLLHECEFTKERDHRRCRICIANNIEPSLPILDLQQRIVLVRDMSALDSAIRDLCTEQIIGFDTETIPVFKSGRRQNPPALMQLATASTIYIIQFCHIPMHVCARPDGLFDTIFAPKRRGSLIVGVGVHDDVRDLRQYVSTVLSVENCIDIGVIARRNGLTHTGIKALAKQILGFNIDKRKKLTLSNWAVRELSAPLVHYAAMDAHIGREVFVNMNEQLGWIDLENLQ